MRKGQDKSTEEKKPGTKRMKNEPPKSGANTPQATRSKPKTNRDKKEEKTPKADSKEAIGQEKTPEKLKKSKAAQPKSKPQMRKRPSFQHDKKIKTTKDIKDELVGQMKTSAAGGKNVLVGINLKKYEMKETLCKAKKGSVLKVVEMNKPPTGIGLVAKTELISEKRESINNEIRFLLEFQQTLRDFNFGSDHILPICSYGATPEMTWFVQPACGPNLDDLRKEMKEELSPATGIRIGLMMLDAISCLHRCELVHGRLEPQHVVIGTGTMRSCAYLVGLGHITLVTPQSTYNWSRTAAFAPCRGSRDAYATELETWFYLLMDLYGRSHLPWNKKQFSYEETLRSKEQFFMFPQLLPQHFPTLFHDLIGILNKSEQYEANLGRVLKRRLLDYMKSEKISRHKPFEWELGQGEELKANHGERMKEYKKMSNTIRVAATKALEGYQGSDDD